MSGRISGKVAIVTGAGQGIGAAIARLFALEGAMVVIAEKAVDKGHCVEKAIASSGGKALFIETDVTNRHSVEAMVNLVEATYGHVDILVNNAGANVFHEPLDMPDEAWDHCMDLDLKSAFTCARAVLPGMKQEKVGSIINIASVHSFKIIPGTFPYPVAKHALVGLTRSLAIEFATSGIRVNAIAPGYVQTQLVVDYWNTFDDPEAEQQRAYELHPPKRIGHPDEVAYTALFLASDEAPFINAETIVIDGGRSVLYHE
jgi:NAD(P)-dependent dehydrogenase (short-subunit alcohol dehydrogenase family)